MNLTFDDSYQVQRKGICFAVYSDTFRNQPNTRLMEPHLHGDMEILAILNGTARLRIDGTVWDVGAGDVVLISPYQAHDGRTTSPDFDYRCVDFDVSLPELAHARELLEGSLAYTPCSPAGNAHLDCICGSFDAYWQAAPGWQPRVKAYLMLFFSYLDGELSGHTPSRATQFMKRASAFVAEHYREPITSADLAALFSYDQSYACRRFHACFSCRFSEYLNRYRVGVARNLLCSHSVGETSALCGFSDPEYFGRIFSRLTGTTPSQYQKQLP